MLIKKTSIRNVTIYLVTAIMFLAFSMGRTTIASVSAKKVSLSYHKLQSQHTNDKFVNDTGDSLELFHELFCEERLDEETEDEQSSYPSEVLIAITKLITDTPSKEVVYYSDELNYNAPVGLYTLFCSWII
jgi:hypothetical protein